MTKEELDSVLAEDREKINAELKRFLQSRRMDQDYSVLYDAIEYTMLSGGKRLRPVLTMEICKACGKDPEKAVAAGCAVEFLQGASLVQDDLPLIDDSPLRRGKPSLHVAFGDANALLASDAMFALALEILVENEKNPRRYQSYVQNILNAIGMHGLIGGEYLDILHETEPATEESVRKIYSTKTEPLFLLTSKLGCEAAHASKKKRDMLDRYTSKIGVTFQIIDDILDLTQTEEILQKPVGNDENKATLPSLIGIDKAKETAKNLTEEAKEAVAPLKRNDFLLAFADMLLERIY